MKNSANGITIDFLFPETEAQSAPVVRNLYLTRHPMRCACGSENFVIANVLQADANKGIPASAMYECTSCGEYRLG